MHDRPICGNCREIIMQLGAWIDSNKKTAILFCPNCGIIISAQLLLSAIAELEDK